MQSRERPFYANEKEDELTANTQGISLGNTLFIYGTTVICKNSLVYVVDMNFIY